MVYLIPLLKYLNICVCVLKFMKFEFVLTLNQTVYLLIYRSTYIDLKVSSQFNLILFHHLQA